VLPSDTTQSYAQHGEDTRLARAFPDTRGTYVDIGAASPSLLSVTKLFYDRGWSGVNVEPSDYWWNELASARPRDINLPVAVSDFTGEIVLFDGQGRAAFGATVDDEVARDLLAGATRLEPRTVSCVTLASIFDTYLRDQTVEFLKIDVEGHEKQVLAGNDWERHRPRVLVVESTKPGTTVPAYEDWEHIVVAGGYSLAAVDPINRFYVRAEDAELAGALRDESA
jgi:FkbM family methyltransferase